MRILIFVFLCFFFHVKHGAAQRSCNSYHYLQQELSRDRSLEPELKRYQKIIEHQLNQPSVISGANGSYSPSPSVIKIPVVVHILYNTINQNISTEQVLSQIKVLNEDFRKKNADIKNVPELFSNLAADCQFEFVLATRDPQGRATTGITRKQTGIMVFGMDDRIKFSALGGQDAWDAGSYLNIWVGNLAGGLIGYSSPLGGPPDKDGVVIRFTAFGTTGTATAPLNRGRTATHEIGHWLGLQHIWGDEFCGNDGIADTPPQQTASRGCPQGLINSCNNNGNMYMNYMDMTNDACMNMFTTGQRARMRAAFTNGGPRNSLLVSAGASAPDLKGDEVLYPEPILTEIQSYPNPAKDKLTLRLPDDLEWQQCIITIHNQMGQSIRTLRPASKIFTVQISSLSPGIYFIKTNQRKKILRFIKS